jgi:hypothetical protein
MTAHTSNRWLTPFILMIYWGCILLGLGIPWMATIGVDVMKHDQSFAQATHQLQLHLFAPGYNLFLIALFNAVPFVLFAVFTLFHMGLAPEDGRLRNRRGVGVLVVAICLVGLSVWTHVVTLWHPDAQGALAYIFLPVLLLGLMPVGYAVGRGLATLILR